MQVSFNTISFTGEKDAKEKRKEAEKKAQKANICKKLHFCAVNLLTIAQLCIIFRNINS